MNYSTLIFLAFLMRAYFLLMRHILIGCQVQVNYQGKTIMSFASTLLKSVAFTSLLALGGVAQSATIYCPDNSNGGLNAPATGRYVMVTNAQTPSNCYYQSGNLQNSDFATAAGDLGVAPANFLLLDKNGTEGIAQGSLGFSGATTGTWSLTNSNIWSSYTSLYLGFHFGNAGQLNPDSFVVQLQTNQLSGAWTFFNSLNVQSTNALSNYYLFGVAGGNPPPGRIPEPGSIALVGLALLAAGAARSLKK